MPSELGYFTIPLPDVKKGMKFYGALFGWTFDDNGPYAHVNNTKLPLGLNTGTAQDFSTLYFAVVDVKASVEQVRALGGTASDVQTYPSGLNSLCTDDQGTRFSLWQPAPGFES